MGHERKKQPEQPANALEVMKHVPTESGCSSLKIFLQSAVKPEDQVLQVVCTILPREQRVYTLDVTVMPPKR
jgi:hypothetical protein